MVFVFKSRDLKERSLHLCTESTAYGAIALGRFVDNQICVDMSSTILEKTRFLQEDIERYEKAIEAELNAQPKTVGTSF